MSDIGKKTSHFYQGALSVINHLFYQQQFNLIRNIT